MSKGHDWKNCNKCRINRSLDDFPFVNGERKARRKICKHCVQSRKSTPEYRDREAKREKRKRKDETYRLKGILKSREYGQTIKGRANRLFHAAKHRAKIAQLDFDICLAHIEVVLMIGTCQKTGIAFDFSPPKKGVAFNPYSPSIDRKNPFEGYTANNIQIVCNAYNLAKNQMTDEQFIEFCKIVVNKNVK